MGVSYIIITSTIWHAIIVELANETIEEKALNDGTWNK
jgi:hypothetical protein